MTRLSSIEVCAGAGGQALGLEQAGFEHEALVEIDKWACATLRLNRPHWRVMEEDLRNFDASKFKGIDLYAGGLPCPPFSIAGKQLGEADERNLFGVAIEQIAQCKPKAVMIENVRGILNPKFSDFREAIELALRKQGFGAAWISVNASDFGIPQDRRRVVLVALKRKYLDKFSAPKGRKTTRTVGSTLGRMMAANGWAGAKKWSKKANAIAPTIVGGSSKHGGPDLGPTRVKEIWRKIGVDAMAIAEEAPSSNTSFNHLPRLTVPMVARLQGFPVNWNFVGGKTASHRQAGNAFPKQVSSHVGSAILAALVHLST